MEKRQFEIEARQEKNKLVGYAIKWSVPSDIGGFKEMFNRGALKPAKSGVTMYLNHNSDYLLANTASGTMKLFSDEIGLRYEATLPNTQAGKDAKELVKRGDYRGVSIGFTDVQDDWNNTERVVKEATLYEVSLVDRPAHASTSVSLRKNKPGFKYDRKKFRWNKLILGA